ncbi:MAG: malto-oligosyltrehalose synthase [Alphaproteobacteria bacterium]|nr:malto-oligosyltrehalose synthase [Alphaproteobacteria bacterium]
MMLSAPRATYRLQLRNGITFEDAARLAPYLSSMGISDLYLSPIFEAVTGSTHGYDVADPGRLDDSLGGEEGFERLHQALRAHGLGLIVDFVPNHMAAHPQSPWFHDVLRWGRDSPYAGHFDIDWSADKLLLPMLAESYGAVLAGKGLEIGVNDSRGTLHLDYGALRLPLWPPSGASILAATGSDALKSLAADFQSVEPSTAGQLENRLRSIIADPREGDALRQVVERLNARPSEIHVIHEAQPWRLADWRAARDQLTYRRFFEISGLIGLTVERSRTFEDLHHKLFELIKARKITGLRLDHVDGLADPAGYLAKLRETLPANPAFPVYVEKIVEHDETLPSAWPVQGTTGYEFISDIASVLVDADGAPALTAAYEHFTGAAVSYEDGVRAAKREIVTHNLAGELRVLTRALHGLAGRDINYRDLGPDSLRTAIVEMAVALPVYRTYVDAGGASHSDRSIVAEQRKTARARSRLVDPLALRFLEETLTLQGSGDASRADALAFVTRFQQTTGPVMAKAVEDTAFYRLNRLIALNEVGGAPDRFGDGPGDFHERQQQRLEAWPHAMNATATHDTKRGEDARARIYAISEMPTEWAAAVARWSAFLRNGGSRPIDPQDEWLFYQALLGAWPPQLDIGAPDQLGALAERMSAFMVKALREAKLRSDWTNVDEDYESAVDGFVRRSLDKDHAGAFLRNFESTTAPLLRAGVVNSLAQLLLKLTVPGSPDIYQGTERWDLSLVDPDNRRPVDFEARADDLEGVGSAAPETLLAGWRDGRIKHQLLAAGLGARRRAPDTLAHGAYGPLAAKGERAADIMAFVRTSPAATYMIAVPRTVAIEIGAGIEGSGGLDWGDTALPLGPDLRDVAWREVLTGKRIDACDQLAAAELFAVLPVALLEAD